MFFMRIKLHSTQFWINCDGFTLHKWKITSMVWHLCQCLIEMCFLFSFYKSVWCYSQCVKTRHSKGNRMLVSSKSCKRVAFTLLSFVQVFSLHSPFQSLYASCDGFVSINAQWSKTSYECISNVYPNRQQLYIYLNPFFACC